MKKYNIKDLKASLVLLSAVKDNEVLLDYKVKIEEEIKKRNSTFVKAPDSYLKTLKRDDVYIRPLKESDEYYYKGMYGMFEKSTNILLRRHTDTGYLGIPKD